MFMESEQRTVFDSKLTEECVKWVLVKNVSGLQYLCLCLSGVIVENKFKISMQSLTSSFSNKAHPWFCESSIDLYERQCRIILQCMWSGDIILTLNLLIKYTVFRGSMLLLLVWSIPCSQCIEDSNLSIIFPFMPSMNLRILFAQVESWLESVVIEESDAWNDTKKNIENDRFFRNKPFASIERKSNNDIFHLLAN